jgi:hypothetical protein
MNKKELLNVLEHGGISRNYYDIAEIGGPSAEIVYHLKKESDVRYTFYVTE